MAERKKNHRLCQCCVFGEDLRRGFFKETLSLVTLKTALNFISELAK